MPMGTASNMSRSNGPALPLGDSPVCNAESPPTTESARRTARRIKAASPTRSIIPADVSIPALIARPLSWRGYPS